MPRPRRTLVSVADTPYYHLFSRCVRRAFLCGEDRFTGRSYEHRRGWIEDRLRVLASIFAVEVCAYAVMSNHYHLVVKLVPDEAKTWSDDEVFSRWTILFKGPLLVQKHAKGESLSALERNTLQATAAVYRERLTNMSWFMKCLNEPIARAANKEDECTGHFWEARFQSQALRTNRALLTAMAYVDLNPIRVGLAKTPEHSAYTSIFTRIRRADSEEVIREAARRLAKENEIRHTAFVPRCLASFANAAETAQRQSLPINELDYFELVDCTGRIAATGKAGRIDASLEPILERLGLSAEEWGAAVSAFRQNYYDGDVHVKKSA